MGQTHTLGAALGLFQHLGRHIDPGHPRIGPKMRQRQAGADTDFENALPRPVVGDPHRLLASRVKHRAEKDVVGAGK